MKTANARNARLSNTQPQTDAQHRDDFDDLVRRATHGDRLALGAIATALSSPLLEEAREVLGEDFAQEAGDVLQDFFVMLLEGRSRFVPAQGPRHPLDLRHHSGDGTKAPRPMRTVVGDGGGPVGGDAFGVAQSMHWQSGPRTVRRPRGSCQCQRTAATLKNNHKWTAPRNMASRCSSAAFLQRPSSG
jgi:hypothetical protein